MSSELKPKLTKKGLDEQIKECAHKADTFGTDAENETGQERINHLMASESYEGRKTAYNHILQTFQIPDDEDDFMLPPHIMDRTIFGVDYKEACSVLMHYKQFIKKQITCNIEKPKITKEDAEKICKQYEKQMEQMKNAREKSKLKGEE